MQDADNRKRRLNLFSWLVLKLSIRARDTLSLSISSGIEPKRRITLRATHRQIDLLFGKFCGQLALRLTSRNLVAICTPRLFGVAPTAKSCTRGGHEFTTTSHYQPEELPCVRPRANVVISNPGAWGLLRLKRRGPPASKMI